MDRLDSIQRKKPRCRLKIIGMFSLLLLLVVWANQPSLRASNETVREFSLEEVQAFAVANSFETKKTQLDILAARKKLQETVASGLPQASSTMSYMNNLELTTMLIPNFFEGKFDEKIPVQFGTQHNASLNLTVNQLIFNGSYFVGLQTSSIYRGLADQNHERTKMEVLKTVTDTYYLILVTEESEKILQASLTNLEKTHNEISELYKEGFVSETDVDLLQIAITKLKNGLQALQRQIGIAYSMLKFQMGLNLEEQIQLTEKLSDVLERVVAPYSRRPDFNLEDSVDYQLLKSQEQMSKMALKNEQMQLLPTVVAFYTFQLSAMRSAFNFFSADDDWYRSQIVGLNVSIPIFKSGAQKARISQARLTLEQARNTREQVARGLLLQIESTRAALDTAHNSYANTKDNLNLSSKVYDKTLIKYKEGVASSMDLTQAHNGFLAAQNEYIQSISQLLQAQNSLDRLLNDYDHTSEKDG
jgi:outer membrane protein